MEIPGGPALQNSDTDTDTQLLMQWVSGLLAPPWVWLSRVDVSPGLHFGGWRSSEGRHRSSSLCSSPWLTPKGPQRKAGRGLTRGGPRIAQQGCPGLGRHGVPGLGLLFCLMGGPGPEGGAKLSLKGWGVGRMTSAPASRVVLF